MSKLVFNNPVEIAGEEMSKLVFNKPVEHLTKPAEYQLSGVELQVRLQPQGLENRQYRSRNVLAN